MNGSADDLAYGQINFIGRITASVTHELNNVIAVTNEVNGLLGDLIEDRDCGEEELYDKLAKIHKRIQTQMQRGQEIIKRLNKFAHSCDEILITVDLNIMIENLVGLSARMAGMKNVSLIFKPYDKPIQITTNPLLLQFCLYEILCLIFEKELAISPTNIEIGDRDGRVEIRISGLKDFDINEMFSSNVRAIANGLSGSIFRSGGGDEKSIVMTFPYRPPNHDDHRQK